MSTTIFILGKDRDLSLAELDACFDDADFVMAGEDYAVVEMKKELGQSDLDSMGGTLKIAKVLSEAGRGDLLNKLFIQLEEFNQGSKLNYGISLYGWAERNLRGLLLDLKKKLRTAGISSRFANQDFLNISTAQSKGLREKGVELLVARTENGFLIAEVVAIQNIDAYSKRDYDKPFRDMKVGMLPPKLAQMMINFAGDAKTIWDPFCGGGVLVMEGLLMGKKMLGSEMNFWIC